MTSKKNSDADSERKFNPSYLNRKSFRSISLASNRADLNILADAKIPNKKNQTKDGDTFDRTMTNRSPTKIMGSSDDREKRNLTGMKSSSNRGKATSDRKSLKSMTSIASPRDRKPEVTGKNCSTTRKIEFPEGSGSFSLLTMAAEKQRQVIEMLQKEKEKFRAKTVENGGGKSNSKDAYELGFFFSPSDASVAFNQDESYRNNLDEILHVWINLFYFIINLRINLIKVLNRSGMENFVPNVKAETEIITKAAESVQLFSSLKIKSIGDALERFHFSDGEKKPEPEATNKRENLISSSFVIDMEYVGNEALEMVNRIKKLNEKMQQN